MSKFILAIIAAIVGAALAAFAGFFCFMDSLFYVWSITIILTLVLAIMIGLIYAKKIKNFDFDALTKKPFKTAFWCTCALCFVMMVIGANIADSHEYKPTDEEIERAIIEEQVNRVNKNQSK